MKTGQRQREQAECRWARRQWDESADCFQERLERHLAECADCRRYVAVSHSVRQAVQEKRNETAAVSSGAIAARAVAQWKNAPAPGQRATVWRTAVWAAVPACATATGIAFLCFRSPQPLTQPAPTRTSEVHTVAVTKRPRQIAPRVSFANALQRPVSPVVPVGVPRVRPADPVSGPRSVLPATAVVTPKPETPVIASSTPDPGDDLKFVNDSDTAAFARRWSGLSATDAERLQREIDRTIRTGDDFVSVPFPQVALTPGSGEARRLMQDALARYQQEKTIIDPRLMRKITLSEKAIPFSDLCAHLKTETGIDFSTAHAVMDDKVTIFCKDRPLRDVMRAITRLFDFAWERKGNDGDYRYTLFQPMRAQLAEEEMRNHDRNEALVDLDHQMEKFRAYMDLSPEEARERMANASGDERQMYEALFNAWGPLHLYFGLSPEQSAALRAGQEVKFGVGGGAVPDEVSRGILGQLEDRVRVTRSPNGQVAGIMMAGAGGSINQKQGVPLSQVPEASATAALQLAPTELGQYQLEGSTGFYTGGSAASTSVDMASGMSPSVRNPKNAEANAAQANDPELGKPISPLTDPALEKKSVEGDKKKVVTSADLLEAFHRATGRDVIGDYYTRPYDPALLKDSAKKETVFQTLCRVCDEAGLKWGRDEDWLTFRSASFFNDRPKEVPARLLERWARARKANHDSLPISSLCEIANLSDVQLDARAMAEGAKAIYGLEEWSLFGSRRDAWRILAGLPAGLRSVALSKEGNGVSIEQMPPDVQERYAHIVLGPKPDLTEAASKLAGATFQMEYQPAVPATPNTPAKEARYRFLYRYNFTKNGKFSSREDTQNGSSIRG